MSVQGTHHRMFELVEGVRGWFRVSNEGVVKSIWVEQPFIPFKDGTTIVKGRDDE